MWSCSWSCSRYCPLVELRIHKSAVKSSRTNQDPWVPSKTPFQFSSGYMQHNIDGLSLTHGMAGSRQHIWSFLIGFAENPTEFLDERCPCDDANMSPPYVVVPFVGSNYFYESGSEGPNSYPSNIFNVLDPVWDREGCNPNSNCCSFNNPPWFSTTLPTPTTDDLELRILSNAPPSTEDTKVSVVQIFIK